LERLDEAEQTLHDAVAAGDRDLARYQTDADLEPLRRRGSLVAIISSIQQQG
jgi:hypothetical protein